jgi:hypothetical protein
VGVNFNIYECGGLLEKHWDHLGTFKDGGKPRKPVTGWPVLGLIDAY